MSLLPSLPGSWLVILFSGIRTIKTETRATREAAFDLAMHWVEENNLQLTAIGTSESQAAITVDARMKK